MRSYPSFLHGELLKIPFWLQSLVALGTGLCCEPVLCGHRGRKQLVWVCCGKRFVKQPSRTISLPFPLLMIIAHGIATDAFVLSLS